MLRQRGTPGHDDAHAAAEPLLDGVENEMIHTCNIRLCTYAVYPFAESTGAVPWTALVRQRWTKGHLYA